MSWHRLVASLAGLGIGTYIWMLCLMILWQTKRYGLKSVLVYGWMYAIIGACASMLIVVSAFFFIKEVV